MIGGLGPAHAEEAAAPTADIELSAAASDDDAVFLEGEMQSEVIEIWAERPDKPFERDTELRLSGKELAERGATNLAEALDLLPDITVRAAGRGGFQVNIRGARKGSIKILLDGVPLSDPYYGNFDISSIPVTDIEQIRVSSSPGSPIDGTGGPGGVIEVHTRDAVGNRTLRARFEGSSLPTSNLSATGRSMLGERVALRLSATGTLGSQAFLVRDELGTMQEVAEERRFVLAAARLEYRHRQRRIAWDGWAGKRSYVVPPGEDGESDILVIDGETMTRNSLSADDRFGRWRGLATAYIQTLRRDSRYFTDLTMEDMRRREDLRADREGLTLLASRPLGGGFVVTAATVFDSENASATDSMNETAGGRVSIAQAASGLRFTGEQLDVDASAGVAVPIGIDAKPWPEAKLTTGYSPMSGVTFKVIGGHKGRVPTLRERFEDGIGNQALGPEKVLFGELVVLLEPTPWLRTRTSSFNRHSSGQIRFDAMARQLVNLGDLDTRGIEARVDVLPDATVGGGASYTFTDAVAERGGSDPLDFLPRHRAEGWLKARASNRAGGTLRVRHVGSQLDRDAALPARTTIDVAAHLRLAEFLATVRVDNALDHDFPLRAGVPNPGRTVYFQLLGDWE